MPRSAVIAQCLRDTPAPLKHKPLSESRPMVISTLLRGAIVPLLAPETTSSLGSIDVLRRAAGNYLLALMRIAPSKIARISVISRPYVQPSPAPQFPQRDRR